jgi:hypothetical protein
MGKREIFTQNPYREQSLKTVVTEDYELWSRLVYKYSTANLDDSLLLNRQHRQSKSNLKRAKQRHEALEIIKHNIRNFTKSWDNQKIEILFSFLKHQSTQLKTISEGWYLYCIFLEQFFKSYPRAIFCPSFLQFIVQTTLKLLWIKFSIIPWKDKGRLLFEIILTPIKLKMLFYK